MNGAFALVAVLAAAAPQSTSTYLPAGAAERLVTVTPAGQAQARIIVLTQAVAIKETGPKPAVQKFGEVYAFSPTTLVVHRDEPTRIEFWNLQGDDDHDFMLMGPHWEVLMKVLLPALQKVAWVFTFHREGLYNFSCVIHQPAMNGQVLVVPPEAR
ncbi:MAG: cupredoxin domain-containing protein [Betaproteobacteria bacterium]